MFFNDDQLGASRVVKKQKPKLQMVSTVPMERINRNFELMSDEELRRNIGSVMVFDVESYWNYFCVSFKHVASGKVVVFEMSPDRDLNRNKLNWLLQCYCVVGFNSKCYDMPICWLAIYGAKDANGNHYQSTPKMLKEATNKIIGEELRPSDVERYYRFKIPETNHIDLIEVAPLEASLKLYAGRLHCKRMQDLPYEEQRHLTRDEAINVVYYNVNDLDNTELLYSELLPQIALREDLSKEYGFDLRSHSDAQIAEAVISHEIEKLTKKKPKRPKIEPGTSFKYQIPEYVTFQTAQLQNAYNVISNANFVISDKGKVKMPLEIAKLKLKIGSSIYKMGIGGLHSTEKKVAHYADENTLLIDKDVASYYPRIILSRNLFPAHIGAPFLVVYDDIVTRRLRYKAAKDRREKSLKITINGGFGKFGDKYSCLYSPHLMIGVTMTGQLALLMLIETIELAGIPVVSGNTDGIIIKCPKHRYNDVEAIVKDWEIKTGFETEETRYKAVFSRDVNNYVAVKYKYDKETKTWLNEIDFNPEAKYLDQQCGTKTKGAFCERGSALDSVLSKNPATLICSDAVVTLFTKGIPIEETIMNCKDIRRFVSVKRVNGGAHKNGVYLGKAIRWYYAIGETGTINYISNGDTVGKSEGAKPLMDLPDEFPNDINYSWYINEANEMLIDLGYNKPITNFLF